MLLAACAACSIPVLTASVSAQSLLDFDLWMQRIERRNLSMQRSLKRKDAQTAIADAREIQQLYRRMEQYFVERGNSVAAVDLSAKGVTLAAKVVAAADDAEFSDALSAAIVLANDCRDCHADYKPL